MGDNGFAAAFFLTSFLVHALHACAMALSCAVNTTAINEEGLFRVPGQMTIIENLKKEYDTRTYMPLPFSSQWFTCLMLSFGTKVVLALWTASPMLRRWRAF